MKTMNRLVLPLCDAGTAAEVGGKAASLGHLIRSGLPVPDGFVVAVAAEREHAARAFHGLTEGAGYNERARAILDTPISGDLRDEFVKAFSSQISGAAAVRSSAIAEDAAEASFAGQFLTTLGVESAEVALNALRSSWASLWSAHAAAYTLGRTPGENHAGMGVIIQQMVNPRIAGVAFSEDPVTASNDVYYAEWVCGTGEALVSGSEISGRGWFERTGSLQRADYLQAEAVPEVELWVQLARMLQDVCRVCGDRQDVEFAWTGRDLLLLQARPITIASDYPTVVVPPPWRLAGYPAGGWSKAQRDFFHCWDEYNPPQVEPLDLALWTGAIWQASIDMLDFAGNPPRIEHALVAIDSVPLQIDPTASQDGKGAEILRTESLGDLHLALSKAEADTRSIEANLGPIEAASDVALLDALGSGAAIFRAVAVTRLLGMQRWIDGETAAKAALEPLISPFGISTTDAVDTLSAGVDHETHRMLEALHDLARIPTRERVGAAWSEQIGAFLNRFGHFESDGIPLSDARDSLLTQIEQIANAGTVDPFSSARRAADDLALDLRARLRSEDDKTAFDQAIASLEHWIALREDSKTRQNLPRPLLRRLITEIGRRLNAKRLLPLADDVTLLTWSELRSAITSNNAPSIQLLQRRRNWIDWKATQSWLPDGFFGDQYSEDAIVLHGIPASAGVATGPARCVTGPEQFGDVQPGDIVVARTTNPVWTQLFSRIAGIVVENGSRLSHAAIVAREFKIPSVVAVPGLMRVIADGERLCVEGTLGEIRRLDHASKD